MNILETDRLTKSFDGFEAVAGVDFSIGKGVIKGVIGPNGAGKTTLLNLISGDLKPTAGKIYFEGNNISDLPPHRLARKGIARTFQIPALFWQLSVLENVLGVTQCGSSYRKALAKAEEIVAQVGLEDEKETLASELAHGDQKRLEIALALAGSPKLLLLDEPTSGLSGEETEKIANIIKGVDQTTLLVEHDIEVVADLSHIITVLHQGRVIFEGTYDEVKGNKKVQSVYLRG